MVRAQNEGGEGISSLGGVFKTTRGCQYKGLNRDLSVILKVHQGGQGGYNGISDMNEMNHRIVHFYHVRP